MKQSEELRSWMQPLWSKISKHPLCNSSLPHSSSPGKPSPAFCLCRLACILQSSIKMETSYVILWALLLSVTMIIPRITQVVAAMGSLFLFYCWVVFHGRDATQFSPHSLSIYLLMDIWIVSSLGLLQIKLLWTVMCKSEWTYASFSWGRCICRSGVVMVTVFHFLNPSSCFFSVWAILHSLQRTKAPVSH